MGARVVIAIVACALAPSCVVAFSYSDYEQSDGVDADASSGGTGGDADAAVVQPCESITDCPAPGVACKLADCIDQKCVVKNSPDEDLPEANQQAGDCMRKACLGGVVVEENDDGDAENDNNPCTSDLCVAGVPSHPALPDNTPCGTSVCAGGFCGCDDVGDCGPPSPCSGWKCDANQCVPDAVVNGGPPLAAGCAKLPPCGFDGACDGQGACRLAPATTPCGFTCSGNHATQNSCDGSGACVIGTNPQNCGAFACTAGTGCGSSCTTPSECGAGFTCSTTTSQCVDCTSCFDWLNGQSGPTACPNAGCNQWAGLITCCGVCAAQCGNPGDLCGSGTPSQCYSNGPPSPTCKACLVANLCGSYLMACEADDGH